MPRSSASVTPQTLAALRAEALRKGRIGNWWTKQDTKTHNRLRWGIGLLSLFAAYQTGSKGSLRQELQRQRLELASLREVNEDLRAALVSTEAKTANRNGWSLPQRHDHQPDSGLSPGRTRNAQSSGTTSGEGGTNGRWEKFVRSITRADLIEEMKAKAALDEAQKKALAEESCRRTGWFWKYTEENDDHHF